MAVARIVARPSDFNGRKEEDAEEWIEHFGRIAAANNWNDQRKLEIIPIYLKGAAGRWFKKNEATWVSNNWQGG